MKYFLNMLLMIIISYFMIFMGFINNPLLGSLMLILISLTMSIYISFITSKWMSFLIILLFLGGMMVLFVYVCTLISSLKILVQNKYTFSFLALMLFSIMTVFMYSQYWDYNTDLKTLSISIMYMKSNFTMMSLCMIYLLFVLVISMKLSQKFKGGMKSKMND